MFTTTMEAFVAKKVVIRNENVRHFLAEFLATYVLMLFGFGVNAQTTLSRERNGNFLSVAWSWSMAVAMGVWIAGGVTGGHLNPAVSLAFAVLKRLSLRKLFVYWLAQYLACFLASASVYAVYYEALNEFDGGFRSVVGINATAGIWSTYPQPFLSIRSGFADQVLGTTLLMICVLAVTDSKNMAAPSGMAPFCIGLIIFIITLSFGFNSGNPLNPARDFAPRAFTAIAGWGCEVFRVYNFYFWIPLVAPHVGAVCGSAVYVLMVGLHLNRTDAYEIDHKTDVSLAEVQTNGKPATPKISLNFVADRF